jgi:hypothetical protein
MVHTILALAEAVLKSEGWVHSITPNAGTKLFHTNWFNGKPYSEAVRKYTSRGVQNALRQLRDELRTQHRSDRWRGLAARPSQEIAVSGRLGGSHL